MGTSGLQIVIHPGKEGAQPQAIAQTLTAASRALSQIDNDIAAASSSPRSTWVVDDITSQNHEYTFRLRGRVVAPNAPQPDSYTPARLLVSGAGALASEPAVPPMLTAETVKKLGKLAVPHHGIQRVSLATWNGTTSAPAELGDDVANNARAATEARFEALGSVSGWLTRVSVSRPTSNNGKITFTIRTDWPGQAVTGIAPIHMRQDMRSLLGDRVILRGSVIRNNLGQVIQVHPDRVEGLPNDNSGRPSPTEMLGSWREVLTGMSSDEILAAIRDE